MNNVTMGRSIVLLICLYWFVQIIRTERPWILLDYATLAIHEGGHVLWAIGGQFLGILGGSLTQLLVPVILIGYFFRQHDLFAAAFSLFWLASSTINVSIYIADAQRMTLPLLGGEGVVHDWHWILSVLHMLPLAERLGYSIHGIGLVLLTVSIIAMIFMTYLSSVGGVQVAQRYS